MSTAHIGETCRECGSKVAPIMWGMPSPDGLAEAEREGWHIGGCCPDGPVSQCDCGATSYDYDGELVDARLDQRTSWERELVTGRSVHSWGSPSVGRDRTHVDRRGLPARGVGPRRR